MNKINNIATGLWWASWSIKKLLALTSMIVIYPAAYGFGSQLSEEYANAIALTACVFWYFGIEYALDLLSDMFIHYRAKLSKDGMNWDFLLSLTAVFGFIFLLITGTASWWAAPVASENLTKTPTTNELNDAISGISENITTSINETDRSITEAKRDIPLLKKDQGEAVWAAISEGRPRWVATWKDHMAYAATLQSRGTLKGPFMEWYFGILQAKKDSAQVVSTALARLNARTTAKDSLLYKSGNLVSLAGDTFRANLDGSIKNKAAVIVFFRIGDIGLMIAVIILSVYLSVMVAKGAEIPEGKYTLLGTLLYGSGRVGDTLLGWVWKPTEKALMKAQQQEAPAPNLMVQNTTADQYELERLRQQFSEQQQQFLQQEQMISELLSEKRRKPVANSVPTNSAQQPTQQKTQQKKKKKHNKKIVGEKHNNTTTQQVKIIVVDGEPTIPYEKQNGEVRNLTLQDVNRFISTYRGRAQTANNRAKVKMFKLMREELKNARP